MTPDVNVLVAASRSDHAHHTAAHAWLVNAMPLGLTLQPMVLASCLRLVTNARVFVEPTPTPLALAFIEALMGAPNVHMAQLGDEWPRLHALCAEHGLSGNDLPDAWLAAAVMAQGEHLVTFDAGFKRLLPRGQYTLLKG